MSSATLAIPDVNVLVALTNPSHVFHRAAHEWLADAERYATTPVTESGLVRMLLNPVVTGQSVSSRQALAILHGVRAESRAEFLPDESSLAAPSVDTTGLGGHKQVTDWHLLNLAAHHEGVLVTFDRKLVRAVTTEDQERILTLG